MKEKKERIEADESGGLFQETCGQARADSACNRNKRIKILAIAAIFKWFADLEIYFTRLYRDFVAQIVENANAISSSYQ